MDRHVVAPAQLHLPAGRSAELARLARSLDAVRAGGSAAVLLRGVPGSGRTTVLDAFAALATARGATVLRATGGAHSGPFALLRELFAGCGPETHPAADVPTGPECQLFYRELLRSIRQLSANGPLVIAVDDAQRADAESIRWIEFLLRRTRQAPPYVILGVSVTLGFDRVADGTGEGALADLLAQGYWDRLDLGPLDSGAVRELVARTLGEESDETYLRHCLRLTMGRPELLTRTLRRLGPGRADRDGDLRRLAAAAGAAATQLALSELAAQPAPVQSTARALALLGGQDRDLLAALTELTLPQVDAALAALAGLGLLTDDHTAFALDGFREAALRAPGGLAELPGWRNRAARLLGEAGAGATEIAALAEPSPRDGNAADSVGDPSADAEPVHGDEESALTTERKPRLNAAPLPSGPARSGPDEPPSIRGDATGSAPAPEESAPYLGIAPQLRPSGPRARQHPDGPPLNGPDRRSPDSPRSGRRSGGPHPERMRRPRVPGNRRRPAGSSTDNRRPADRPSDGGRRITPPRGSQPSRIGRPARPG
ncbi:hypothetical protein P3T35_004667 [Kitasatospora sp. GP30]|uniref:ATP-binding protein n=1 Tax=Kitasatospora sp. GP30 TaxID=3035084 RepID=UPI000C6FF848|nr:AAA family ATPase [Kitasatospora sp. GP30]MDH6142639.1 hypothetical protein [Kitasatospora sp. GP30]